MGFFSSLKKTILSKKTPFKIPSTQIPNHHQKIEDKKDNWEENITIALRKSEPDLSIWLDIVIANHTKADDILWKRLHFFLISLGINDAEATLFTKEFADWANYMGYTFIADFRSELQYRLALALDLEDKHDEKNRLIAKIHTGLTKTREHFTRCLNTLFSHHQTFSKAFWEELEELFIMSDMGVEAAKMLTQKLQSYKTSDITIPEDLKTIFAYELENIFKTQRQIITVNPPEVILVVGVNGVGKTTTIAKLAYRMHLQGKKVLIAAADTFRAAAVEQLTVWAKHIGVSLYAKEQGTDPASVAWESIDLGIKENFDTIIIDTAGRLHTQNNLMDELTKIRTVIQKKHPGAPHRTLLIIDATSGQNALQQTKFFHSAIHINEIILTKLDGTAKGGIAIAIALLYNLPITYVGLGEKMEDLRPFVGKIFAQSLLTNAPTINLKHKSS